MGLPGLCTRQWFLLISGSQILGSKVDVTLSVTLIRAKPQADTFEVERGVGPGRAHQAAAVFVRLASSV